MAKMTRGSLKSLVKECLFEILLEASDESTPIVESSKPRRKKTKTKRQSLRPALDMMKMSNEPQEKTQERRLDVSGLTSDPIMAAIFQDTARTTLVEQADAERRPGQSSRPADAAAAKVAQSDPTELFAGASKNWATLAFDE